MALSRNPKLSARRLAGDNALLRARLAEADHALRAIRGGEVDALVVHGEGGNRVFTLRGADHSYRVLIEGMSEGALIVTEAGDIFYANHSFARMLGAPLEEVIGTPLARWVAGEDRPACAALLARDEARASRQAEAHLIGRGGQRVPVHLSANAMPEEGMPLHFGVIATDLTEQRSSADAIRELNASLERKVAERTAELQATNRELESFSYSVSHDLQAPLRVIDGFSAALQEDYGDKLDAQGKDGLARVRAAAQRMGRLIDDLLRLARLAKAPVTLLPLDVGALAREIARTLKEEAPARQVRWEIEEGLRVHADRGLFEIALKNLIANAWKFTARTAQPVIRVGALEEKGVRTLFVADNGAGFDMAHAERLFAPFQRLHGAEEFPGTGIGLALVQRIVHRHGGRVWAEARPGEGATFFFTLGPAA